MRRNSIKGLILCIILVCITVYPLSQAVYAEEAESFENITISILGDSISTYENASSGLAAETTNTTIKNNRDYYTDDRNDVKLNDTWWMQAAQTLGAEILVNNSYSGSRLFYTDSDNSASGFYSRPYNLHDNTGDNAGQEPDIIAVYMGTNDITHNKKYLGTYESINYATLIREINGEYVYKTPQTSAEAYAIMLHKISVTYENAEIYCFTIIPRVSSKLSNAAIIDDFNNTIKKIAEHQNCYIVDLCNDSGITKNDDIIKRYLYDAYLHPNRKGMDAIESAFISSVYTNSKYTENKTIHNVSYNLTDVIVNEGTLKKVEDKNSFTCTFSQLKYGKYNITVTMNGEDISKDVVINNSIHIPSVSGDVEITAKTDDIVRTFKNYRFEKKESNTINIAKNENHSNNLTKTDENTYKTEADITLCYDTPWALAFRINDLNLSTTVLATDNDFNLIWDAQNNILGFYTSENPSYIYGIKTDKLNLDKTKPHTFKITNTHNDNGTNTFKVFIDSKEAGEINSCFESGKFTGNDIAPIYEKDFIFNLIGTQSSENIEYIQVWESESKPNHIHTFDYPEMQSPTCTEPGSTITTCDCGETKSEPNIPPSGHTEGNWITSKKASAIEAGEAYKLCSVCNQVTQTKSLPQLKCAKPRISSVANTPDGIKITWNKVSGADAYRVYRHIKNGKWVYICTTSERTFIDTNIKNGYWYYYTVRAVNEAGYSDYNKSGNVIQALFSPTVKTPKIVQQGIKLSWSKVTGAQGYYVYRKVGNGSWKYYCRTTKLTYTDKKVSSGKSYAYRVRAYRNETFSGYDYDGAKTVFLTAPSLKKPTNTTSGVKVQWNGVAGAKGYNVYRKTANSGWKYLGKTTSLYFIDKTASAGKTYTYTVKAYNEFNQHSPYNTSGITIKRLTVPKLDSYELNKNGIKIKWQGVSGANGYYVYRKVGNGDWQYMGKTTKKYYTDKTAQKGTTYTYTVKAYSGSYVSTYNAKGITAKK